MSKLLNDVIIVDNLSNPKESSPEECLKVSPEKKEALLKIIKSKRTYESFNYIYENQTRVYIPGSPEEKNLVRLIDLHMLPCICLLYLLNYLDRSSIGNAKIGGMSKDLNLSSSDYSLAVLIFTVGYLLTEVPSNMILSKMRPSRFLPIITFCWGLVVTCFAAIKNKSDLVGVRFILGFVESGFFPGVLYYLSSWYRRGELAKRIGIFYTAGIISGAFGGILSGTVITNLDGVRGIRGWRWLFIIEGIVTMVASLVVVYFLPDWPSNTRWLNSEQRALAKARLDADAPLHSKVDKPLTHLQAFKAAISDWRTYLFCFMYTMITSANSVSYFIPTITVSLGYSGQKAQFMTVPIHACAVVSILLFSLSADYFNETIFHIAIPTMISGLAYAICIRVTTPMTRYGLLCIGFGVIHGAFPVVLAWLSREVRYPDTKRAICQAIVNSVGNSASIYGSFLWSTPPKFVLGFSAATTFCLSCTASVAIACLLLSKFPSRQEDSEQDSDLIHETAVTNYDD
ncbi:hypothetical protein CROQUDRAFT_725900 [Cronartium quercuum f. sp. fusiforme G11]|uniref:Major facilitator superfamily (MFS) profile domain-containing protein n=1 Tax=Cronartium quercuum f. sp. fusiforme G11 TaxID=708437 RepID=A0A9P6N711_9BASI|nr:hypothetical protein CROQUDRAFT_725900 [Cronartium quercuum f. sp. fusiforme G11]